MTKRTFTGRTNFAKFVNMAISLMFFLIMENSGLKTGINKVSNHLQTINYLLTRNKWTINLNNEANLNKDRYASILHLAKEADQGCIT